MVSKTSYLGVTLSYRAWEIDTIQRRLQAAQMYFSILRKWLTTQVIPRQVLFRLYH